MPMQLMRKPANLDGDTIRKGDKKERNPILVYRKKAIREMERSSRGDREEAKIERKTAGVTGMRLFESIGGC